MNPALFKYGLLKILQLSLILLGLLELSLGHQEPNFAVAKRHLFNREKNFLQHQPMSESLKNFINRFRTNNKIDRKKREDINENQVYVIQNGQLVPLQKAKSYNKEQTSEISGFTVVPLIVPIKEEKKKSIRTRT